jgi:hypothetical protein
MFLVHVTASLEYSGCLLVLNFVFVSKIWCSGQFPGLLTFDVPCCCL